MQAEVYMSSADVCYLSSKRTTYLTRKLDFCMKWFKMRESCTSISVTSSPGITKRSMS